MPWVPKKSRTSGKTYYFHTETKKTTWKRPADLPLVRRLDDDDERDGENAKIAAGYALAATVPESARAATKEARAWNNKVKRLLLERYHPPGLAWKVLDLACGRGGDMGKILRNPSVRRYRGVDVSDEAVQEAVRRTQVHNRHGARLDFLVGDMRTLDWCALCDVADAGSPYKEWTGVADGWRLGEPYDAPGHRYGLINMQYALHYACATREGALAFLKKVHGALADDGLWVGTVPCADRVRRAAKGAYPLPATCRVEPCHESWAGRRLGEAYRFFLEGCVPGLKEFLVPGADLDALALEAGLSPVLRQNAAEFVGVDEGAQPLVALYDVFVFRKSK